MDRLQYQKNELIFRQGDEADCMYMVHEGTVGIFLDYGGPCQTKLNELHKGQFLGEMGLLDSAPRSATAVSLEDGTEVERIRESGCRAFFGENRDSVLALMQQMCSRLRRVTREYAEACRTVADVVEAEKSGEEMSDSLKHRISKILAGYENADKDTKE